MYFNIESKGSDSQEKQQSTKISLDKTPHDESSSVNQFIQLGIFPNFINRPTTQNISLASYQQRSKMQSSLNNEQRFFDDVSIDGEGWLHDDPISNELASFPFSSNSKDVQKAIDFTFMETCSTATHQKPLHTSNDLLQQFTERKRKQQFDSIDSPKRLLVKQEEDSKEIGTTVECNTITGDNVGSKVITNNGIIISTMSGINVDLKTETNSDTVDSKASSHTNDNVIDGCINADTVTALKTHFHCSRNISTEWNQMKQLVTVLCRNELNHFKPLSETQIQLQKSILIQMSLNPDQILSNSLIAEKCSKAKLKQFINECKVILMNLRRTGPDVQSLFSEWRDKTVATLKSPNDYHMSSNFKLVESKIKNIIDPLFNGKQDHELVSKLMKNPHALEDYELVKKRVSGKTPSTNDVMNEIKVILDSFIQARQPETFHFQLSRYFDVPFAVNLYQKSAKMTEKYAKELKGVVYNSIKCLKVEPKPNIIDMIFIDGSLKMVCLNRMSFDWLEKTISNHLGVKIIPVKVISKNELKTICLKFQHQQFFHFNNLMEELKKDNPRLFTERWELRNTKNVDSTKCIYVGVDIESLIILEKMKRVGIFRKSFVFFEISYDDENFELMDFVKKKRTRTKNKKNKKIT